MKKIKYFSLILLVLLLWTAFVGLGFVEGFLLRPITSEKTSDGFIEASKEKIAEAFVGNLALAIIEDGEVTGQHFYSIDQEIDEHTVFQVASVSKWITSVGIMKLVEQGKLDLDTPVDDYLTRWHLPPSDFDNQKVTVRRLLSHSSGLIDDLGYDGFTPNEPVQSLEESLTQAADASYAHGVAEVGIEPGTTYMYSGAGYTLLQLLIEELSGQSFQVYMTQTVFEPLEMEHSTFVLSEKPNLHLATRYNEDGSIPPPATFTALAAASLFTCTADLSKFMRAHVTQNVLLSAETVAKMSLPEAFINDIGVYGLGPHLYSQKDTESTVIGHDGSSGSPVINTAARIDLQSKDGIIVLEMGNYSLASALADEWLFWKAGIADFTVMQRNINYLLTLLIIGYLVIIAFFVLRSRKRKKATVV